MNNEINADGVCYLNSAHHRIAFRPNPLAASLLENPAIERPPLILFCGGFHSNMRGTKAQELAEFCTQNNWPFMRFDYRGHGESEGDAEAFTLHDWLADTTKLLDVYKHPVVIIGSSMGAWLATLAALHRPSQVIGLVLLAAAPDFLQELVVPKLTPADTWDLQQDQIVSLPSAYESPFPITQALLDSGKDLSLLSSDDLANLSCPIRLLHGTSDIDVPFSLSIRLMDRIVHSHAQLTLLHKADHRLSDDRSLGCIKSELRDLLSLL
ncbi:MAG: alpha/beta hydrolase [Granulosicoccus sp.]